MVEGCSCPNSVIAGHQPPSVRSCLRRGRGTSERRNLPLVPGRPQQHLSLSIEAIVELGSLTLFGLAELDALVIGIA
jgi:hypothetical protein